MPQPAGLSEREREICLLIKCVEQAPLEVVVAVRRLLEAFFPEEQKSPLQTNPD